MLGVAQPGGDPGERFIIYLKATDRQEPSTPGPHRLLVSSSDIAKGSTAQAPFSWKQGLAERPESSLALDRNGQHIFSLKIKRTEKNSIRIPVEIPFTKDQASPPPPVSSTSALGTGPSDPCPAPGVPSPGPRTELGC